MPRSKVILLGIETQIGLTIIRELGRHGVEVHGIASSPHSLGLYSRYLSQGYRRAANEAGLLAQLGQLSAALAPCHIMAISENDIDFLNRSRSALSGVKILVPSARQMELVLDKSVTLQYAEDAGIKIPRSFEIASLSDLELTMPEIHFPTVTKWKSPLRIMPALEQKGITLDKVRYCRDEDELRHYFSRFQGIGEFPLIQEYCAGYGLGQFVFMHRGEPILKFQHRRIHEYPPEGGFSTLCESLPEDDHTELMEKSVAMLRRMEWEGAAMVEYRFDPETDEARLMEINGRFWGSLPLAYYSGAEFAWLTYAVLGEGMEDQRCVMRSGVRCRAFVTETKRLWRILFAPGRIRDPSLRFSKLAEATSYVREFFNLRTRYFVFAWSDQKPFFADMFFSLVNRVMGH
jgi:predicted ATP-grasp superfamily ATP-dependent carboligase